MKRRFLLSVVVFVAGVAFGKYVFDDRPPAWAGANPSCANGDVNGDQDLNLSDPVYVLQHLFLGGPAPLDCCGSAGRKLVILVRHAERDGAADALSKAGKARAEHLATLFDDMRLNALIASDRERTQQTLSPLATKKNMKLVMTDDTAAAAVEAIKKLPPGSKAVVAHHSYTIPGILLELGATESRISFPSGEYDNAWVLFLEPGGDTEMVPLKFGCPSVIPDTCDGT